MRRDEVLSTDPAPEELEAGAKRLPRPGADAVQAVRAALSSIAEPPSEAKWPPFLERARMLVDSRYTDPATSHRKLVGPALVGAKRAFRTGFQPLINEVMRAQVRFNEALLDALLHLHHELKEHVESTVAWRAEVNQRLERLEAAQAQPEPKPIPPARKPKPRASKRRA